MPALLLPAQPPALSGLGLVVDSVAEVVKLTDEQIEPTPDFGVTVDPACLLDMAKVNGRAEILLDIDRVVGPEAIAAISARAAQARAESEPHPPKFDR